MSGARIDREDRMKKLLLGTTALIAAGAFVGAAQAADDEMMAGPVTVGVAGYTTWALSASRATAMTRIHMRGLKTSSTCSSSVFPGPPRWTTASRWLSTRRWVGPPAAPMKLLCGGRASHITLSGAFGSLRIGRTESAAFNATVAAPGAGLGGNARRQLFLVQHRSDDGGQHLFRDRSGRRAQGGLHHHPTSMA